MIDTNEQLRKMFEPYEQVDEIKLSGGQVEIDKDHPIYWICVDNNGDLCCGKSTNKAQVNLDLMLACHVKQILYFKKRENV